MLKKLEFGLHIFEILEVSNNFGLEDFTLHNFRNYLFYLYNNKFVYDFCLDVTYNVHLINVYDKVFSVVPFKLKSLIDNEELIDTCYNDVKSGLDKYLAHYDYKGFLILYISKDIVNEIDHIELIKRLGDSTKE